MSSKSYNFQKKESLTYKANQHNKKKYFHSAEGIFEIFQRNILKAKSEDEAYRITEDFMQNDCDSANENDWWMTYDELEKLIYNLRIEKQAVTPLSKYHKMKRYSLWEKRIDQEYTLGEDKR